MVQQTAAARDALIYGRSAVLAAHGKPRRVNDLATWLDPALASA